MSSSHTSAPESPPPTTPFPQTIAVPNPRPRPINGDVATRPSWHDLAPLELRAWTIDDVDTKDSLIELNGDYLTDWLPWVPATRPTPAESAALIDAWQQKRVAGTDGVYAIVWGTTVVGSAGLHSRIAPSGLEIGYWVSQSSAGHRIATAVAASLTRVGLARPGIDHIEIHTDAANFASQRVARNVGMELVGEYDPTQRFGRAQGPTLVFRTPPTVGSGS